MTIFFLHDVLKFCRVFPNSFIQSCEIQDAQDRGDYQQMRVKFPRLPERFPSSEDKSARSSGSKFINLFFKVESFSTTPQKQRLAVNGKKIAGDLKTAVGSPGQKK